MKLGKEWHWKGVEQAEEDQQNTIVIVGLEGIANQKVSWS
jgi:hypothetical protein